MDLMDADTKSRRTTFCVCVAISTSAQNLLRACHESASSASTLRRIATRDLGGNEALESGSSFWGYAGIGSDGWLKNIVLPSVRKATVRSNLTQSQHRIRRRD